MPWIVIDYRPDWGQRGQALRQQASLAEVQRIGGAS